MKHCDVKTPLGVLRLTQDGERIRSAEFTMDEEVSSEECSPLLEEAKRQLCAYFDGSLKEFDLPICVSGTEFEMLVMQALLEIPYGQTRSYGQIARRIGMPAASRAVGRACSRNQLLIIIPCHRVIAASGKLTGFAAGIERKRALLDLEGATYRE